MESYQIIRYLKKDCSISERNETERWINESEGNKKIFNDLKEIWETSENVPDNIKPDIEKAWNNIRLKTGLKDIPERRIKVQMSFRQLFKVAAVLLVLVSIGAILTKIYSDKLFIRKETNMGTDKKEVLLADGTTIFMNRSSQLIYPKKFKGNTREIQLKGEAFFDVAKDSSMPFIVHAGGTIIKVLGTSFNVKEEDSSHILVSVLSGKVAFSPEKNESVMLYLEKGEHCIYDIKTQQFQKSRFSDKNFLAWKTGIITFNNRPLNEAVRILSDYYSIPIEVQTDLQDRLITVSFENQPLEEALKILELTLQIRIENNGDRIILKTRSNS